MSNPNDPWAASKKRAADLKRAQDDAFRGRYGLGPAPGRKPSVHYYQGKTQREIGEQAAKPLPRAQDHMPLGRRSGAYTRRRGGAGRFWKPLFLLLALGGAGFLVYEATVAGPQRAALQAESIAAYERRAEADRVAAANAAAERQAWLSNNLAPEDIRPYDGSRSGYLWVSPASPAIIYKQPKDTAAVEATFKHKVCLKVEERIAADWVQIRFFTGRADDGRWIHARGYVRTASVRDLESYNTATFSTFNRGAFPCPS